MTELEAKIGYRFRNIELMNEALTHSSYANEHKAQHVKYNERLEFLGDAVLELSSSRYFYDRNPEYSEGQLSRLRAACVCEPSLGAVARRLGIGSLLRMGKGEKKSGGEFAAALFP